MPYPTVGCVAPGCPAISGTLPRVSSVHPVPAHGGTFAAEHLSPSYPERAAWGTAAKLRGWQEEALAAYLARMPRDFLASATPGAGKTVFALRVAAELRGQRRVDRITVVTPTEHLKHQWADAAARAGIRLDPHFRNASGDTARHYDGAVVTYAQVASRPALHERHTALDRTLVILDEVHHGGDALSWGDAIREAFGRADFRLSLTGTPFRSDEAPIPFVAYQPEADGTRTSVTDFSYGYGRALADGVVRPVMFLVYSGTMRWKTRAGDAWEARLGDDNTRDITASAWRTALDPEGEWIDAVLRAADRRLSEVRASIPDAGGLVIATDQAVARAYARLLHGISGEAPTVVLSDDSAASARIDRFAAEETRWMVAVRMVSEGVDVPRLAVGVYATSSATPLFFAQAVGRFVRARRRGETATVFLPNVPVLLGLAHELERERDHVLGQRSVAGAPDEAGLDGLDAQMLAANRTEQASDALLQEGEWQALGSDATFDRAVFNADEFGAEAVPGSLEELDFLGIPGLLDPEQVAEVLRYRQARQVARGRAAAETGSAVVRNASASNGLADAAVPAAVYRTLAEQRRLLNGLVGVWARETGEPHGHLHAQLRRACGGPPVAQATVRQLQARIDWVRQRLA